MSEIWDKYLSNTRIRSSAKKKCDELQSEQDKRNDFESDFGRVIFSAACRRLHDKTQVFPLTTDDNIHSRLTHSMEVMNIGYSFAINLSKSVEFKEKTQLSEVDILRSLGAILKTSCLVHDIGNPPFGHFGEESIQNYFTKLFDELNQELKEKRYNHIIIKSFIVPENDETTEENLKQLRYFLSDQNERKLDFTEFDGNAQGFRVLTKLQFLDDLSGLNLTCATLASSLKYPNISKKVKEPLISLHKHGVFTTEESTLKTIVQECNLQIDTNIKRHPLAFLMEAADSICYLVMDIEDAINKDWICYEKVINLLEEYEGSNLDVINKLVGKVSLYSGENSPHRKKVVCFRTVMIAYLTDLAIENFIKNIDRIYEGTYQSELIDDDPNKIACALNKISYDFILSKREIRLLEITGDSIICGIMDSYINLLFNKNKNFRKRGKSLISKAIIHTVLQEHLNDKGGSEQPCAIDLYNEFDVEEFTTEERLRIIRDYVSGMTDSFALNHYRRLNGQQIQ